MHGVMDVSETRVQVVNVLLVDDEGQAASLINLSQTEYLDACWFGVPFAAYMPPM